MARKSSVRLRNTVEGWCDIIAAGTRLSLQISRHVRNLPERDLSLMKFFASMREKGYALLLRLPAATPPRTRTHVPHQARLHRHRRKRRHRGSQSSRTPTPHHHFRQLPINQRLPSNDGQDGHRTGFILSLPVATFFLEVPCHGHHGAGRA